MTEDEYMHILKLVDEYDDISCECAILFEQDGWVNNEDQSRMKASHKNLRDFLWMFVEENES